MKIAIWGTKKEAEYLCSCIDKILGSEAVCFIDNDKGKHGDCIKGRPVYSIESLKALYPKEVDTVILALRNGYSIMEIVEQLQSAGISKIGLLKPLAYDFSKSVDLSAESRQILWLKNERKPLMGYLQVILIKTCNLNCKGCTHFANLFNLKNVADNEYDINELEKDMGKISKNAEVFRLRLLGGEPLLYNHLKEAVELSRKLFSNSDIRIVTNGVLLLKVSDELLNCVRENQVGLDISLYKPTAKIRDEIEKKLRSFGIDYCFEDIKSKYIEKFEKNVELKQRNDPNKSMTACKSKQCQTLMNGRLYKCPFEALSYVLFDYFGQDDKEYRGGH